MTDRLLNFAEYFRAKYNLVRAGVWDDETIKAKKFLKLVNAFEETIPALEKLVNAGNEEFQNLYSPKHNSYQNLDLIAKKLIEIFKREAPIICDFDPFRLDAGIRNVFYTYMGFVYVIPFVYKQQFNTKLDDAKYLELILSSSKFARQLSKIHFDVFRAFIYATTTTSEGLDDRMHEFQAKHFQILDLDGKQLLWFKDETLDLIDQQIEKLTKKGTACFDEPIITCPASFVKSERGDMISLSHDWIVNVLKQHYLPLLKTLKLLSISHKS